ncbi:MAG TPA: zinc-dependent peptidase [Cyclobacteriaceae bacterium]|nr:zinc-dependent peptidase [Cyclobacteriaceae bacterium]
MVVIHVIILLLISLYVIHHYLYRLEFKQSFAQIEALYYLLLGKFPQKYNVILEKYFLYYKKLNESEQKQFEHRLLSFIASKEFIARKIPKITDEMRVLISACAIQLSFGLPQVTFKHFNKILVYPDDYYSTINKKYHKGEVNPAYKIIVLSWKAFLDAYINPHDSKHLGLHEMAHALHLENMIRNGEENFLDKTHLANFDAIALAACKDQNHEALNFFRNYACADTHEFFAVAVENFFQRPREMREKLPQIYQILSALLHQDPASK